MITRHRFIKMSLIYSITVFLFFLGTRWAFAKNLSGNYMFRIREVTLTLMLKQDARGNISGILSSTTGTKFQLKGITRKGVGTGACYGKQGTKFFIAHPQGNQLLLTLIEPDASNRPDFRKARRFPFKKQKEIPSKPTKPKGLQSPSSAARKKPQKSKLDGSSKTVGRSDLRQNFIGRWAGYSGNWQGGTSIDYTFHPDGTFSDASDTSYSLPYSSDGAIAPDSYWATSRSRARWTVRGSKRKGKIIISFPNGNQRVIKYRVHVKKGRTYWHNYWFNGIFFYKK